VVAAVLAVAPAWAQDVPPVPERFVTDLAGVVSAPAEQALDARLATFEKLTGHQVLLWIGPSGGQDPESFAVRAFESWGVGRAGIDDGLVMFLFPEERRSRIEVGYGLEGVVPDAIASRVLRDVVAPRLQAGDWDGATSAGMDALLVAIDAGAAAKSGAAPPPVGRPVALEPSTDAIVFGIAAVAFLVLLVVNPRLAMALLWGLAASSRSNRSWSSRSGWGSSGGHGGGGGFSGGGGRSGGGGASGSW
jgi:uncharacterized protein